MNYAQVSVNQLYISSQINPWHCHLELKNFHWLENNLIFVNIFKLISWSASSDRDYIDILLRQYTYLIRMV